MLKRLTIRDFGIIEHLEWRPGPGLNVITGETGAGKSLVLDALDVLLGRRTGPDVIRAGSETAVIEAEIGSPSVDHSTVALTVRREVERSGRGGAYLNGRPVPVRSLRDSVGSTFDLHGPNQQFSLLDVSEQLLLLDTYGGLLVARDEFSSLADRLTDALGRLESIITDEQYMMRRRDMLAYEAGEIRAATLMDGEEELLKAENMLLSNVERQRTSISMAWERLYESGQRVPSGTDNVGEALESLKEAASIDRRLDSLVQIVEAALIQLEDVGRELAEYRESLEYDPARHAEVQARLDIIASLKRKYGGTVEKVIAHGERAEMELASLESSDEQRARLESEADDLRVALATLGERLSRQRRVAAENLAAAVECELADLNMAGTGFMVAFEPVEGGVELVLPDGSISGFNRHGIDDIEFLIRPNPGEPFLPLSRTASTGESSRLMLAVRCALSRSDLVPTLVFDEIDMGIGGRSGEVIGRKLVMLSRQHQVICITHLPQVAAYGDTQYRVQKKLVGDRTSVEISELLDDAREAELSEMLGNLGEPSMFGAQELLQRAGAWKRKAGL